MVRVIMECEEEGQATDQKVRGEEVGDQIIPQNLANNEVMESAAAAVPVLDVEKESEDTFKKPVFISRIWGQVKKNVESKITKENAKQEGDAIKDEDSDSEAKESSKSPAQQLVEKSVPIPYKEPSWSGLPPPKYSFEVLKSGTIVEVIPLTKPFIVLGRLEQCDVVMQHPSLSRYHCIVQYRAESTTEQPQGFYTYDLGSTHGSYHNKHRMKPHIYYRLRVGHLLKLAGSTRTLILQGPEEDQEEETEESASQLMAAAAAHKMELERLEAGEEVQEGGERNQRHRDASTESSRDTQSAGIDWGMGDDAQEEEVNEDDDEAAEGGENPFAKMNEEVYVADPKKTLRGWLEREGYDLPEYCIEDVGRSGYSCSVNLPTPGPEGGPLVARVEHKGKKKDAVVLCAREACRLLDKMGVLRQAIHESLERRRRDWSENDYYDSDEDDFLDRTGDVQRKRLKRMEQAGKGAPATDTYDTLLEKYREVIEELGGLEEKLAVAEALKGARVGSTVEVEDDLDSYMSRLKDNLPDKHKRVTWKLRAIQLRKDELRLLRLINVARPLGVPELKPYQPKCETATTNQLPSSDTQAGTQKFPVKPLSMLGQPKEPTYQVHKIFMEEELEYKPRLKRLDDDDGDLPKPQPYWKKDLTRKDVKRPRARPVMTSTPSESVSSYTNSGNPLSLSDVQVTLSNNKSDFKPAGEKVVKYLTGESVDSVPVRTVESRSPEDDKSTVSLAGINTIRGKEVVVSEGRSGSNVIKKELVVIEGDSMVNNGSETVVEKLGLEKRPTTSVKGIREQSPEKKARILGPMLPPHLAQLKTGHKDYNKGKKKTEKRRSKYDEDNPNYNCWMPPKQQTGDGKTSLNQKFGY